MTSLRRARRICVVTGSRAEYGLLYWLLREVRDDTAFELQIVATGMHLSHEFGLTYQQIERDGFVIDAKVEMLLSGDSATAIAKSMAIGLIGLSEAFERLRPEVVVLLGDRFEIFAAAQAAMVARIPLAHISGGEVTEGGLDDAIRHSLSKMSYFHFVSAEPYRLRVIQMGEDPARVINCGDPGVERLARTKMLSREPLSSAIGFDVSGPFFLVTYHPATLIAQQANVDTVQQLFAALDEFPDHRVVITKANADEGGRSINDLIDRYTAEHAGRVHASASLGQLNYSSAMSHCDAVIGNSSSGIVEAPALRKPTVNIGDRQKGRLMASSIISCGNQHAEIAGAIRRAMSREFQESLTQTESLYGSGKTSVIIKDTLKTADLSSVQKAFYDAPSKAPAAAKPAAKRK